MYSDVESGALMPSSRPDRPWPLIDALQNTVKFRHKYTPYISIYTYYVPVLILMYINVLYLVCRFLKNILGFSFVGTQA